ncbi:putative inhibitor of apoptosis [Watersipora subatra]|uniref:putative inhibitor of apoptosis n=1 Tax=Watersipora subatra TaxID=2589382 RepID=UPI00355AE6D9
MEMPERNFDALDGDRRKQAVEYVPGYDWIPGRFGPPPGIPKDRKEQFDRMSDKEFLYAFLKLSQEEKESLMVSERERQRTFAAHWPIETIVKAHDCAKEGFYYTGVADRVQCAFCGGIVRNWERGDVPKYQHKNFFNYCKMVQNKPCQNIPISNCGLPKDRMTSQLSSSVRDDRKPASLGDLNINTNRPKDPPMSVYSKRMDTYRRYPSGNPIAADKLCEAGFLYEGIGDKVKCFWCDGALEMWSKGDDPWAEHAKWYPGCTFVQQTKGLAFIKTVRLQMTPDNIATSETLLYNKGDVSFLEEDMETSEEPVSIEELNGYKYCQLLDYPAEVIAKAYEANDNVEFEDQRTLLEIVQELYEGNSIPLEEYIKEKCRKNMRAGINSDALNGDRCLGAAKCMAKDGVTAGKSRPGIPKGRTEQSNKPCPSNHPATDSKDLMTNVTLRDDSQRATLDDLNINMVGPKDPSMGVHKEYKKEAASRKDDQSVTTGVTDSTTQPGRRINVVELITNPNDPSEQECKDLVDALRCKKCRKNMSGAVVLPCGCYCLCQDCSKGNLPAKCPACASSVKGACRTFLT